MYSVKRMKEEDVTEEIRMFIFQAAIELNKAYGTKYNWARFPVLEAMNDHYFSICFKDNKPVGLMVGTLTSSIFDPACIILSQITQFALPKTRAAYYLMRDFIDFGNANANHTVTMLNTKTNIKARSLEKLGFKKTEEIYRLEN